MISYRSIDKGQAHPDLPFACITMLEKNYFTLHLAKLPMVST